VGTEGKILEHKNYDPNGKELASPTESPAPNARVRAGCAGVRQTPLDSLAMTAPASPEATPPPRGGVFSYESFATDADRGLLTCRYSLDGRSFTERVSVAKGPRWNTAAAQAAARLVFLLAGVSYYKTAAPAVIDLGELALTPAELAFLREFYLQGLGEFAYRNALDLTDLRFEARRPPQPPVSPAPSPTPAPAPTASANEWPIQPAIAGSMSHSFGSFPRALVPFGGGVDSIVTVERVRQRADVALFVVNRPGDRFKAIERPAAVSGLPIVRAEREIDPQLLRSADFGFLNGHVPVTGILSAIGILAAVLTGGDAVIMSNEWSASVPTLVHQGRPVNHQYSKSASFEAAFRGVLAAEPAGLPEYFSALRDRTELWIAEEFAALTQYHTTFRSCNRAFAIDTTRRLGHWCGQCDKCCFIDLILAPFMSAESLRAVFAADGGGAEPLANPALAPKFATLLGSGTKPFECVGEVNECRAAVLLAARRPDRADCPLLQELAAEVAGRPDAPTDAEVAAMRSPVGENFIPAAYAFSS
jgi:UDP-N-acetyl-alpha-D-muramoyl-L-alanyl-L-glutamate epimerase